MAPPELEVRDEIRDGVPLIKVTYDGDVFQAASSSANFSSEILSHYDKALGSSPGPEVKSVVVEIHADVAGSSLIRGLFDLYRSVVRNKGQIVCVGFPKDYIPSLTSLGLLDQSHFSLGMDTPSAIAQLKRQTV